MESILSFCEKSGVNADLGMELHEESFGRAAQKAGDPAGGAGAGAKGVASDNWFAGERPV